MFQVIIYSISKIKIVVNYDENDGWSTLFDNFNKTSKVTKEVEDALNKLNIVDWQVTDSSEKLAKQIGYSTDDFYKFAKQADLSGDVLQQYKDYISNASSATSKFGATLKSVAANIGIMLAINLAIKAVTAIWNEWNVTVEEVQQKIDEHSSSLETLNKEYEKLNSRDAESLSQSEKDRLQYLKDRIEYEEKLLEIEKANLYREQVGTGFTDYFDKDSLRGKELSYKLTGDGLYNEKSNINTYEDILKENENLNERLKGLSSYTREYQDILRQIDANNSLLFSLEDEIISGSDNVFSKMSEAYANAQIAQDVLNSGYLTGSDKEDTEYQYQYWTNIAESYEQLYNRMTNATHEAQTAVESISERLGNIISVDELKSEFSAEDLELLVTLTFDKNASIEELKELLAKARETVNSNKTGISFADIFELEDANGNATALGKLNNELDEFQKTYTGLKEIMDSYNKTGTFTLDQVQEILSYGDEYLKYLMDENGNLQLNEEALNNVAKARIEEMRAKTLETLISNLDNITSEEIALDYLKNKLYETAEAYDVLTTSAINAWKASAFKNGLTDETINKVEKQFLNEAKAINEIFDNINIGSVSSSKSSSAEIDFKDILDKYLSLYEAELDAGLISFDNFLDKSRSMIEQYYADGKITAADYWDYVGSLYEKQLKGYDRVINAVTSLIDDEIEKLEEQKSAIEESYELRISKIQEEIDSLQEANDERQRQYELEKARYELERAMNSRTKKVLTDDRGFIYTTDDEAIREAQNNLAERENELKISKLESQIDALEREMKSATQTIEQQIDRLNKYKDSWNDVADEYEKAQDRMYAANVLGADYESQILAMRTDVLNNFANNYIATQQAIANAAVQSANAQIQAINAVAQAQRTGTAPTQKEVNYTELAKSYKKRDEVKSTYKGTYVNYHKQMAYASGTEDAKSGIHEVSENGDEIILDNYGNAILAQGHQLHAFEGGETVINSKETIELLKNQGRLVPVESLFDRIDASKFIDNMPHLTPNIPTPNYDLGTVNNSGSSISIGDIHIHKPIGNVDSFADAIIREFPNKMNQRMNKR